jgi:hypothetical protein
MTFDMEESIVFPLKQKLILRVATSFSFLSIFFILHTTLQLGVPNAKWDYTVGRLRCKNSTNYMLVMSILRLKL